MAIQLNDENGGKILVIHVSWKLGQGGFRVRRARHRTVRDGWG